ncbi:hypothetical protein GC176_20775, partial [bacterium]|nr:hypothetical protein [bacterium]
VIDGGDSDVNLQGTRETFLLVGTGAGSAADPLETAISFLSVRTDSGDVAVDNTGDLTITRAIIGEFDDFVDGVIITDLADTDPAGVIQLSTTGTMTLEATVINNAAGDIVLTAVDAASTGQDLILQRYIDPFFISDIDPQISSTGGMITLNVGDDLTMVATSTVSTTGDVVINLDNGDADSGVGTDSTFDGTWTGGSLTVNGNADDDTIDASAISFGATFNGSDGDDSITGTSGNDTITGGTGDDTLNGDAGDDLFLWSDGDGSDMIDGGADSDEIDLVSGTVTSVDYTFASENDGTISVDAQTIMYTNLEPVIDDLDAMDRSFSYIGGTETITLSDDGTVGDGFSMIDSTQGEVVTFAAPTNSLTIDAGDGDDTIDLQGLDATFDADLTINGGDGTDSISAAGDTDVGSGVISIGEASDVESLSFDGGSLITTSDAILVSTGAIADNDGGNDVTASTVALGSGTGVGSAANALDTTINALEADGGTGGVWISNTGDLVVNDIDATLIGVTANGDIELTTSTLMLTFEPLDSNGGNIRLTAVDDIVIVNDVSSDGGDITVNSDSDGTGGGGIYVDGAIVSSSGGNIVLGGGADPTLNPAVATGFLGGQGVTVDAGELNSGTGDISIRGASALSDDAVDFSSVAVATTTSGNITIIGDSTGGDDGVDIDSGSMVSTVSGNITLTGNSTGTADEGIALDDMTITTQTGQITITGTGANGSGIHVGGRSINSVDGDIQLTGTATSNGAVGVDIATGSLSSLVSLSGAQNVDAAAWNLAEIVTIESSTTIPHITINGTGNDTFDVYSFTAGAGDRGIFDIANNSFDTELFLFDSSFNLLDSNDDFDDGDGDGTDSTIDFTFASSGTFYLVVGRYDSSAANGTLRGDTPSTGDTYDLHFSIENHALVGGDDPLPEVEPNDPVLQAGTSAIAATGTGSVTIIGDGDGASAGVRLDGTVGSSSGGVTIQSADDNIEFAASAAVTSVSGMISVSADTMGGNGGQVIMSDGSSVDTSTGLIDVSADGDITLSKLQTTDAVTISSAAGSVIDGGDSDIEITATSTIITAPGGVGTLAGGGADNAIETALDSLSVDTSGGNGDQAINETDALTSLDLNAGTGTVTLVAGGAISDVDGSADITADSASVSASGGIAIATAVTTFAATNDTPGDITVSNSGPLTVGSVSGTVGVSNSAAGGMILIAASSPLTVASDVTASGDITLTSTDSTGTGDDLTIDPGVTVQSTTGNVSLRSGDDVLISAGSIVDAAGVVTIDGDFGDADAGTGSTIDIFGTVNTVGQGIIRGQGDDDVITLDPDATTGPLLIDGQGGDDQYFIQTGSLGGQIDIDDQTGAGNDELNVSGTTNPDAISADASQIVVNTTQVITYTSSLETVNADGGNGADAFDVTPSTTAEINILGSGPAMIPGDMLTYNAPSGATVTFSPTDSDTGTISSTGGVQNVNYDLVEGVKIDGAAGAITLVVNGSSEDDVFNVDFAGGDSGTIDLTLDADGTPGPTTMATVGFTSIQTVQLNGSDGDDILQVTDPADGVSGSLDFNGEGGSDSIVLVSGTATTLTHNFDTAADGSIDIDGAIINYTGLEPITDNIDASNRVFNFAATDDDISLSDLGGGMSRIASLSSSETVDFTNPTTTLTVNGGDGADTIDASTLAFDVTLNGGAGNDSLIGTDGFDQLNGDAGDDTLAGGTSNDTLSGGDDDDLIVWNDGDGSDSVDGNAGTDTLQITASNASGDDVSIDPNGTRFVVTRNNLSLFSLDVGTIETAELNTLGGGDTLTVGDLSGVSDLTTVALNGGDDNDVLDLQGLAGGPVALVDGGDGDDTLLASTGSEGDDGTADDLNLSINGGLGTLDYTVNAILVFQATPSAGADQVIINGSTDDDALTLDFAVDSPLAPGGTFFNGGSEQTGGDNLTLINGTVTTVTHNFANASDGTIEIEEGTTDTITYTGLEPIFDNLSATDRVFNFGATDDVISLSDLGGGLSRIESVSSSETVDFVNPSGSLTINAGDGADTVSASASSLDVTIHGGAGIDYLAGGSGNDAISGEDEPDIIIGSGGNDTLSGGDGEDIFIWEEGDGDDVVNGDADIDRQIVNAADNAAEGDNISVSDNGARIDITRAAGVMLSTFTLDVGTTEIIEVNSLAGDDTIDASALTNAAMDVNAGDGSDTVTGGSQNDTLAGNGGNDVILGGDGDDTLRGGANTDMLNGQSGNDLVEGQGGIGDQLTGETGDDTLDGGASGDDVVIEIADQDFDLNNDRLAGLLTGTDLLIGIELADLTGGAGSNFILAADFDGDTTLRGLDGNDTIIGGSARDTILGGVGDDSIEGHDGNDHIDAGDGSNFVLGGDGNDRIYGGSGNDTLAGEGGNDRVFGLGGDDLMFGGTGSDAMRGGAGRDTLNGEDGPDNLFGQGGSGDVLQGGTGDDNLDGGSGNDRVYESADTDFTLRQEFLIGGTTGTDSLKSIEAAQLEGGASANLINADGWLNYSTLNGGAGNDTVVGSRGGSLINGGNGDDTIIAGRSSDRINGDAGNDNIDAGRGDDIVNGGAGDDLINGNRGADTINGDAGNDRIFGVTNADYPHDPVQPQILETVNNTDNDSLLGGDGDDTIVGGLGSDFVSGGDGANVLDVTSGGDGIDGIDTVSGTMLDAIFQDPTDLLI